MMEEAGASITESINSAQIESDIEIAARVNDATLAPSAPALACRMQTLRQEVANLTLAWPVRRFSVQTILTAPARA